MSFSTQPKKIILVGSGFLGKYFLLRLLEGYEEYLLKNGKEEHREPIVTVIDVVEKDNIMSFPLFEKFRNKNYIDFKWSSAGDTKKLEEEKILDKADAVVYTAAIADVPFALRNPNYTWQVNYNNTMEFMRFLDDSKFKGKIIGLSSESVYGHQPAEKLPIKEDKVVKPNPANYYGESKLAQENAFRAFPELDVTILRSATMYGPYGRMKQAMPIFIRQIMEGKPVTLEGDGSQTRDFVYVEDTAHAIELALYTKKKTKGQIINIGSGKEVKFLNLIHLIRHTLGLAKDEINIQFKPFRVGEEGLRVWLDISKAKKLLDYSPMYPMSGVDSSALKTTIEWIANSHLNYDEKEMDNLRKKLYPMRYATPDNSRNNDIQVSV